MFRLLLLYSYPQHQPPCLSSPTFFEQLYVSLASAIFMDQAPRGFCNYLITLSLSVHGELWLETLLMNVPIKRKRAPDYS